MKGELKRKSRTEVYYPESNKKSIAETQVHLKQIFYLIEMLEQYFYPRNSVYVLGVIEFSYKRENSRKFFAPDVMVVKGVGNHPHRSYKLWEEKQFPQVVFEISSRGT